MKKPRLVPTTLLLVRDDVRIAHPLTADYLKEAYYTQCQPVTSARPPSPIIIVSISGRSQPGTQTEMASVRRSAVALIASFLVVAAVGAQPMDPKNPISSDPNVIPVYMSPGSPPTYVSCYNSTHGQQGSEPTCSILARQCPRGCRDTCYVHCPSCKLVCRKQLPTHTLQST